MREWANVCFCPKAGIRALALDEINVSGANNNLVSCIYATLWVALTEPQDAAMSVHLLCLQNTAP